MKRFWTDKQDNLLRRHYGKGDLDALAARLGVSRGAVKSRAAKIGLRRKVNVKHPWSDSQLDYLRKHYADEPMDVLMKKTKHCKDSIENKAHELGLRKSKAYLAELGRKTAQKPGAVANRFKKGQVPFNKGKKAHEFRSPEAIAKCQQTQFEKGHRPHNTRPVGYERIDKKDGYIYVKVAEGQKLVHKHRFVWEQHNGPIPDGYCVSFHDGDKTNCDINNLFLISREDNARRTIEREPEDVRRARVAKGTATRNRQIRLDKIRLHWGLEPKGKLVKRW